MISTRAMALYSPMILTVPHVRPGTIQERRDRRRALSLSLGSTLALSAAKNSIYFLGCQNLVHISHGGTKRSFAACSSVDPGVPLPPGPPSDSWKWILGMVMTFVLPFLVTKWGPLLKIKNEVDNAVQTVENVVDAVEKVAEKVEKIAEDISDNLPAGELKSTLLRIENVADQIDDKAELIGDLIDKAQEVEDKIESAVERKEHAKEVQAEEVKGEN